MELNVCETLQMEQWKTWKTSWPCEQEDFFPEGERFCNSPLLAKFLVYL